VRLLASTHGPETNTRLLALLDDPQPDVRQAAVFAAARALGSSALPQLLERLEDTMDARRQETLTVLAALLERLLESERVLPTASERKLVRALQHDLAERDDACAAIAVRALGLLGSERARTTVRSVLDDARPGRSIAALRASTSDRGSQARQRRAQLLAHHDARVAASALVALTLAEDPIPVSLAVDWLHDTSWPRGPAASFALARAVSRKDASVASFEPCTWLASDEPITRSNMIAALQQRPSRACPSPDRLPLPTWLVRHAAMPRRPDEPAALILEDSSVIVSLPDAGGRVDWPKLAVVAEVSAFLASGGPL
jgi:HEAT repeat protein